MGQPGGGSPMDGVPYGPEPKWVGPWRGGGGVKSTSFPVLSERTVKGHMERCIHIVRYHKAIMRKSGPKYLQ